MAELSSSKEYVSSRDAARLYRVTNDYIARLCRQGKIVGVLQQRTWLVEKGSLQTFFARKTPSVIEGLQSGAEAHTYWISEPTGDKVPKTLATPATHRLLAEIPFAREAAVVAALGFLFVFGNMALASFVPSHNTTAAVADAEQVESPFFSSSVSLLKIAEKIASFFAPAKNIATAPEANGTTGVPAPVVSVPNAPAIVTTSPTRSAPAAPATNTYVTNTYPTYITQIVSTSTQTTSNLSSFVTYDFLSRQVDKIYSRLSTKSSSGGGITDFSTLTASDIPDISGEYLSLAGGVVNSTTTLTGLTLNTDCTLFNNGGKLTTDVSGNVVCDNDTAGSGSGTPGGSNTHVQYNDGGDFGGDAGFTYNETADRLTVTFASTTGVTASYASTTNLIAGSANIASLTAQNLSVPSLTIGSLSGLLKGTAGTVSVAIAGTDYIADTTGNWSGTFDGQEGSYYLNASNLTNFSTPFAAQLAATTTTALAEGSNLYYTLGRFASALAGTTTTALAEGLNLYYTPARATANFVSNLAATTSVASITTLPNLSLAYSQLTGTPSLFSYPFPSNATTTQIAFNGGLTADSATITYASSTAVTISGTASTTNLVISSIAGALLKTVNGVVTSAVAGVDYATPGSGSFEYPFPSNATTTLIAFDGGLTATDAEFDSASTTNLVVSSVSDGLLSTLDGAVVDTNVSDPLVFSGNALSIQQASAAQAGYLSSANWTLFNSKLGSTSINTSAELAGLVTDETGSGALVFGTNAILSSTTLSGNTLLTSATTTNLALLGVTSKLLKTLSNGSIVGAVAGVDYQAAGDYSTFDYLFSSNATSTHITFNGGAQVNSGLNVNDGFTLEGGAFTVADFAGGGDRCLYADDNGTVSVAGAACGSGGGTFSYPFPSNATTTQIAFSGGATFVGATTTALAVTGSTTISSILNVGGAINANGGVVGNLTGNADTVTNGVYTTTFNSLFDPRFITQLAATTSVASITTLPNLSLPYSQLTGAPTLFTYPFPNNATTSVITFSNGALFGSTTIGTLNATSSATLASTTLSGNTLIANATTTNLAITGISGSLLKTLSSGAVVAAVAGTDYLTSADMFAYPFPSNATSTEISFNGGVNVSNTSSYKQGGASVLYASSTTFAVAVGASAAADWLAASSTPWYNIAIGQGALSSTPTSGIAGNNTAIGALTLSSITTGSGNTAIGSSALHSNTTGLDNFALGASVLYNNTEGDYNVGIGTSALVQNTTGDNNIGIGRLSLQQNLTGGNNVAIGAVALNVATSSINNTAIGVNAGAAISAATGDGGNNNTLIGYQAGSDITKGNNNIVIGSYIGGGTGITSGSSNILIGEDVRAGLNQTGTAQLNIGNLIFGTSLGNSDNYSTGSIGIGTTTPGARLSVQGDGLFSGNASFAGLVATGTVRLATYTSGALATDATGSLYTYSTSTWSFASSTLLANDNTFSGNNTFSNTITGSISGNAGTVTNGVYTTTFNSLFDPRFITQLAATSSVSSITTLPNLSLPYSQLTGAPTLFTYPFPNNATTSVISFSNGALFGSTTIGTLNATSSATLASTTLSGNTLIANATTTNLAITGAAGSLLSTNASGAVVATSSVSTNYLTGTLGVANGGTGSTTLGGLLSGNSTSIYSSATGTVAASNGITVTLGQAIIGSGLTITGTNAAADGSTKGVASFTAADFDASSGNISLDYTNGQAASASLKGFLTSADWTMFNAKLGSTSIDTSAELATLVGDETGSGALVFGTNATLSSTTLSGNTLIGNATSTNFAITGVQGAVLKTLSSGAVVAAVAGVDYQAAGNYSTFSYPFPSNATTSILTLGGLMTGTSTIGALTATSTVTLSNYTSGALAVTSTGSLYTYSTSTWSFASSTLLANDNTFSGNNTFSNTITGSISGNAGAVTNGVYTTTFNSLFDPRFITQLAATTSVASITTLPNLSLPYSQLTGAPAIAGYPFAGTGNSTSTLTQFNGGLTSYASTTIGAGGATTGLTISGGATTTGTAYFASNVGIGVSSPAVRLQVHDPDNTFARLSVTNSSSGSNALSDGLVIESNAGDSYIWNRESGFMSFGTSNTERLVISSTGDVGISSSTPGAKLSVNGDAILSGRITGQYFIATSTASASIFPYASTTAITASHASTTALIVSGLNSASCDVKADTNGVLSCGTDATGSGSAYPFAGTGNSTSTLTQFNAGLTAYASSTIGAGGQATGLTISGGATTTGSAYFESNVGIGTQASYPLDVNGRARVTGTSGSVGAIGGNSYGISVQNNAVDSWIEILNNGGAGKGAFFGVTSNNFEQWNYQGGDILFYTAPSASTGLERLRITNAGNVGIGTSTPGTKLGVSGDAVLAGKTTAQYFAATSTETASVLPYASTTAITVSGTASTTNLVVSSLGSGAGNCLTTNSSGVISTQSCGGSSFSYPFPSNATSTLLTFSGGISVGGTLSITGGRVDYSAAATSTIPNNTAYAWTLATSTTARPLINVTTTTGTETVTIGLPGSDVIIGGVGSAANLVFEESSTIHGQGGNTLTFGTSGDKINFAVNTGFGTTTMLARIHAEVTGSSDTGILSIGRNASYAGSVYGAASTRAANSGYYFFSAISGYEGTPDNEFLLRGDGNGFLDGSWTTPADFAEWTRVVGDTAGYQVGDLVAFATTSEFGESDRRATLGIKGAMPLGVVTLKPGVVGVSFDLSDDVTDAGTGSSTKFVKTPSRTQRQMEQAYNAKMVALEGYTPIHVSTENGPLASGDGITFSSIPGVGMKAGPGDYVVGYAFEAFDPSHGAMGTHNRDLPTYDESTTFRPMTTSTTTPEGDRVWSGWVFAHADKGYIPDITLEDIFASSTLSADASERVGGFWTNMFGKLATWLGDASNGIANLFATTVTAETVNAHMLCLDDLCITRTELQSLLNNAGSSGTTPPPAEEPTDTGTTTPPVETADDVGTSTPPTEEPADEPTVETPAEEPADEPAPEEVPETPSEPVAGGGSGQ